MAEHTPGCPRPWYLSAPYNSGDWRIRALTHNGGNGLITHLYFDPGSDQEMEKANAQFIIRACNAHDELLVAAMRLLDWSNHHLPDCPLCGAIGLATPHAGSCPVLVAANAIAKAKGATK